MGRLSSSAMTTSSLFVIIVLSAFVGCIDDKDSKRLSAGDEYQQLYASTDDKDGLESIRALHEQLDDDRDGTIEPAETGDFIRVDLHDAAGGHSRQQLTERQRQFHRKDTEITVKDLWITWWRSDVHNWTVDQTAEWLEYSCQLPQYADNFRRHNVNGAKLPLVAVGGTYLNKVVGISNPIHRSKITLKAMDVVLFGPPKDANNILKDIVLTGLLVLTVTAFFYAHRQNKKSKESISRLMADLDSLSRAEQELKEMQQKMNEKDFGSLDEQQRVRRSSDDLDEAVEVERLKGELEMLRDELHRAEVELEDKCWMAPPVLQHWLQLTYEVESAAYNARRRAADEQLATAKDMCDRLKRKRSSLVGAFVSTHGRSVDDVDRSILEAKTALLDLTKDLQERTARWRQIEMLCGCSIMTNPGIAVLQNIVRHVGAGRHYASRLGRGVAAGSADDMVDGGDIDAQSVAASSTYMTTVSSSATVAHRATTMTSAPSTGSGISSRRSRILDLSRQSSKDSSSSEELPSAKVTDKSRGVTTNGTNVAAQGGTPVMAIRRSPTSNGHMMVKSHSQDPGSAMASVAMVSTSSDTQLVHPSTSSKPPLPSLASSCASAASLRPPEESCSDSGSLMSETSANGKKGKKKRSFFNFRRKKERVP